MKSGQTPPQKHGVKPSKRAPFEAYLTNHLYTFISTLGRLSRNPLGSLMTTAVIAIALSLPTSLYLLLGNVRDVGVDLESMAQISLFMKPHLSDEQTHELAKSLHKYDEIKDLQVISREEALKEFMQVSGFADTLSSLEQNPLPAVIVVHPVIDPQRPDKVDYLLDKLRKIPEVDIAQLDLEWLRRLYAILEIAHRSVMVVGALLALAVLLVVGNTIRLDIQNRREEIEITKLIGATNAFVRRPFLYTGFWYGFSGGVLAVILVVLSFELIEGPVSRLTMLYNSNFELISFQFGDVLALLTLSSLLGLLGSWVAVSRHLYKIEPS